MTKKTKNEPIPPNALAVFKALNDKYKEGVYQASSLKRNALRSSGSIKLDKALGGGYVGGKIIEIYGKESSGKTTLAYAFLAANSPGTSINGFIDAESSFDTLNAESCGVNVGNLIVQKPTYLELGMEMTLDMVEAGLNNIVFDSLAGIGPKVELEKDMMEHSPGKVAFRAGQLMRKLHTTADYHDSSILFVNQIRSTLLQYGPQISTPGGNALKFHASYRLWIKGTEAIESKGQTIGHYMKIVIIKNKFKEPGVEVLVPLIYGHGVSREWEIKDLALEQGIIAKNGSWYSYGDTKLAQGESNVHALFLDNPDLVDELKSKLV